MKQVLEQLKDVAKGEYKTPDTEKRKFGNIVFAAVTLPVGEIKNLLDKVIPDLCILVCSILDLTIPQIPLAPFLFLPTLTVILQFVNCRLVILQ